MMMTAWPMLSTQHLSVVSTCAMRYVAHTLTDRSRFRPQASVSECERVWTNTIALNATRSARGNDALVRYQIQAVGMCLPSHSDSVDWVAFAYLHLSARSSALSVFTFNLMLSKNPVFLRISQRSHKFTRNWASPAPVDKDTLFTSQINCMHLNKTSTSFLTISKIICNVGLGTCHVLVYGEHGRLACSIAVSVSFVEFVSVSHLVCQQVRTVNRN